MKLLLRRDQRAGTFGIGKPVFILEVRAEISAEESGNIATYKLGDTLLYERSTMVNPGSGLLGLASRLAHRAMNLTVYVRDLTNGKRIECKDILEMLAVEDQIKEAAKTFNQILLAASHFGGEEVIDLAA